MTRFALIISLLLTGVTTTYASGTKAQEDACKPDVRRFCYRLHPDAGDDAFLACLQQVRPRLSPKCRRVLEENGV
jgi:hypothetical protein